MIEEVGRLLNLRPFERFRIVTSSGGNTMTCQRRTTRGLNPRHSRVVVWFDDDSSLTLSSPHITAIEETARPGS